MNRATARAARAVARRPPARFVEVTLEGGLDGWWARARADFPAALLIELGSGDIERIVAVLEVIIVEHNLPGADGRRAEKLADVAPWDGLIEIGKRVLTELGRLPPR